MEVESIIRKRSLPNARKIPWWNFREMMHYESPTPFLLLHAGCKLSLTPSWDCPNTIHAKLAISGTKHQPFGRSAKIRTSSLNNLSRLDSSSSYPRYLRNPDELAIDVYIYIYDGFSRWEVYRSKWSGYRFLPLRGYHFHTSNFVVLKLWWLNKSGDTI